MAFSTRALFQWASFCFAAGLAAFGQISNVEMRGATATQIVISYVAPDERGCSIEVSQSPDFQTLVHDVNPALFPDSNMDLLRPTSLAIGRDRIVVVGLRAAKEAADRRLYSRALQTDTEHHVRISCQDGSQETMKVRTTQIPIGMTYSDPPPANRDRAGEYAWPSIDWENREQTVIDPQTGVLLKRATAPFDRFDRVEGKFGRAVDQDGAWRNPTGVLDDDAISAVFRGPGRNWLYLSSATAFYQAGSHDGVPGSLDQYRVRLNAWCSSSGCASALPENRMLEACLTVNGVSCATPMREVLLESCSGACREARYQPVLGAGDRAMLGDWSEDISFDITDAHMRSGAVDRNGAEVIRKSGNPFGLRWTEGSWISIGGVMHRVSRVINQDRLRLAGSPEGEEKDTPYQAPNFGVLIRKKTESAEELVIQHARFEAITGSSFLWDAGGDGDTQVQCSPVQVNGPDGEPGWNCSISTAIYWIGAQSGTVNPLGHAVLRNRSGPDGWSRPYCPSLTWDRKKAGVFYCALPDTAGTGSVIVRGTYAGTNRDAGRRFAYQELTECGAGVTSECFYLENITPVSRGLSLQQQLNQFHPEWKNFKTPSLQIAGTLGLRNAIQLLARRDLADNDTTGVIAIFDLDTYRVTAAANSWKSAPMRWATFHGPRSLPDPNWISLPATGFRGPFTGADWRAGNGPYVSRIAGAISAVGEACPARPANSPIPSNEWPTGNRCVTVTVDGEPADPTPLKVEGRFTANGQNVRVTGTTIRALANGSQVRIGNDWFTYQYIDDTQGRLSPQPPTVLQNTPFVLFEEPVNNPKTGNPLHGYLQDAEPGDIFCGASDPTQYFSQVVGCSSFTHLMEYFRLVSRDGKRWTLQRGYFGPNAPAEQFHALPAGASLIAAPSSCVFQKPYSCATSAVFWNTKDDPQGVNQNAGMRVDTNDQGGGHNISGPLFSAASVSNLCPRIEGDWYTCYNIRAANSFVDVLSADNQITSLNPRFSGMLGVGSPNGVDSHPSFTQLLGPEEEKVWFTDARPLITDTANATAVAQNVDGFLWKYAAGAHPRLRPKVMPTYAFCGVNPLVDVSGPLSKISGEAVDSFKYCLALKDGECTESASAGELFVNCPYVRHPNCAYPGVAVTDADQRDLCIGDLGPHTGAITQVAYDRVDMNGRYSRMLTRGLSRYRFVDVFWNVKTTPDGKWGLFRTAWLEGKRTEVMMAKMPPFPADDGFDRTNYIPVRLEVPPEGSAAVAGAVVEFGYDKDFRCTSRDDACVKGAEPGTDYSFASQPLKAKDCAGGCFIELPILPQRVYYFRVRYVDVDGKTVSTTATAAWTTP